MVTLEQNIHLHLCSVADSYKQNDLPCYFGCLSTSLKVMSTGPYNSSDKHLEGKYEAGYDKKQLEYLSSSLIPCIIK